MENPIGHKLIMIFSVCLRLLFICAVILALNIITYNEKLSEHFHSVVSCGLCETTMDSEVPTLRAFHNQSLFI